MKITFNFIMLLSLSLLGCQQKEMPRQNELPDTTELLTEEEQSTTHTDTHYKYEYRTGNSGDYGYNYDVSGYDIDGKIIVYTRLINPSLKFPMTMWKDAEAAHSVENLSKTKSIRLIRVEMKN